MKNETPAVRYKGRKHYLRPGMVILIGEGQMWRDATIIDTLSSQFTVDFRDRVEFLFYRDVGDTWRPV